MALISKIEDIRTLPGGKEVITGLLSRKTTHDYQKGTRNDQTSTFVKATNGRLFFHYEHPDDKRIMPIVANEEGTLLIGKRFVPVEFVNEVHGTRVSRYLGCNTLDVKYGEIDEKPYMLSEFIFPSRHPTKNEVAMNGQSVVVPRALSAEVFDIAKTSKIMHTLGKLVEKYGPKTNSFHWSKRFLCYMRFDLNNANFLMDDNGTFTLIDFAGNYGFGGKWLTAYRLAEYGITADPQEEIVKKQIQEVKNNPHLLNEMLDGVEKHVDQTTFQMRKKDLAWNYTNIERMLDELYRHEQSYKKGEWSMKKEII